MRKGVVACAVSSVLLLAGEAAAQGVCVECKGPERGYRCAIKEAERVQQFRGSQRALEFVCLSQIARVGGHESCRISTGYAGPCIGQPYEVDLTQIGRELVTGGRPPAADPSAQVEGEGPPGPAPGAATAAAAPAPTPAKKGPPETLEQLARETVSKSKEQLSTADESVRKAGGAVGDAVKQTWECLASLFKRC